MQPKLVPLRIPPGWTISFNQFTEVDPDLFINDDFEYKWEFNEDIFQFFHKDANRVLDLGWSPEFRSEGEYKLVLIDTSDIDWLNPLYRIRTRNLKELINQIEFVLLEVTHGVM